MESPFYLDLLTRGAKVWDERRQQNPTIRPDLIEVDLRGEQSDGSVDARPSDIKASQSQTQDTPT